MHMAAKDIIHDAVRAALQNDGWTITHDPYTIEYEGKHVYADLAAERILAAERQGEQIVVEIKSFLGYSLIQDFKEMLGQYMLYLSLLVQTSPERKLLIAVDSITYENDFQHPMIELALTKNQIPLIVVDIEQEVIVQWID